MYLFTAHFLAHDQPYDYGGFGCCRCTVTHINALHFVFFCLLLILIQGGERITTHNIAPDAS